MKDLEQKIRELGQSKAYAKDEFLFHADDPADHIRHRKGVRPAVPTDPEPLEAPRRHTQRPGQTVKPLGRQSHLTPLGHRIKILGLAPGAGDPFQ